MADDDFATEDLEALCTAKRQLEYPSLAAQIANLVGVPIEKLLKSARKMLPRNWGAQLDKFAQSALLKALELAVFSLGRETGRRPSDRIHTLTVTGSGAVSGLFGLGAAAVEIPFTTVVMMRSIAEIARQEGHDISRLLIQLECLSVFALGGPPSKDDAAETGYWAVRSALAREVSAAAAHT